MINSLRVIHARSEAPPPDKPLKHYPARFRQHGETDAQRLPVLDAAGEQLDGRVWLGDVVI